MHKTLLTLLIAITSLTSATATDNAAPVALDDYAHCQENTAVSLSILDNDFDTDGSLDFSTVDLDTFTLGIQSYISVSHGICTVDDYGVITFTPDVDYVGLDTVAYTVCDTMGLISNIANLIITVTPTQNYSPIATFNSASCNRGSSVTISILDNDYDFDGELDYHSVDLDPITPELQSTINIDEGVFTVDEYGIVTFTPNEGFVGVVSDILYTVCDNMGAVSNTSTISITVYDISHSVIYDANSGSNAPTDNNYYYEDDYVTVSDSIPSKEGYDFIGWAYKNNTYEPSSELTMPFNDVILVAQWTTSSSLTDVSNLRLDLFPNPANEYVTIDKSVDNIKVYTLSGSLVSTYSNVHNNTRIDITSYPTGMYLFHINKDSKNTIKKLIKK